MRAGRQYLVGEDGPELFRPNFPGNLFPNGMFPNGIRGLAGALSGQGMPQGLAGIAGAMTGRGGFNFSEALAQYRSFADELLKPIRANIELPRAGPIRQRASRRVEAQRERDVGRMTRYASNSDIGIG